MVNYLILFIVSAAQLSLAAPARRTISSLSPDDTTRSTYVQIFRNRVETAKLGVEKAKWAVALRQNYLDRALKANSIVAGTYPELQIQEYKVELNRAKIAVLEAESLVAEAESVASVLEQSLALGIDVPIIIQMNR